MVRDAYFKEKTSTDKESYADIVTETDKRVEAFLFDSLRNKYSTHTFIGEESTVEKLTLTDNPTWIIDPIDGTTNFFHKFPYCSVSVAFFVKQEVK